MRRRVAPVLAALLGLLGLLVPAGARAAVVPPLPLPVPPAGPNIVVSAPGGARVVITRAPFGLQFVDATGRVVLREAASSALPMAVPPVAQAEFGTIGPPPPTLYAPLGFLVGRQSISQEPAGQWEGDLASVTESGIEYSAQQVLSAQSEGAGVLLTVSTNDPTGRRLLVHIAPAGPANALSVSVRPSASAGVATMADSFASSSAEAFRGFGGRHNSLDEHGAEFYNWLQQENVSSGSGSGLTATTSPGGDTYMFPNGPEAAYYVQSSFLSSAGYGFLLARDEISHWRMDSDRPDAWQTEAAAAGLDYTVVPADAVHALASLTAITGRQRVPPQWAAGSLFDREVKYPSDPPAQYAAEVQNDIDTIAREHLHVDAYRIEGWAELARPVLSHLIGELRARGIHPLLYFRAFVGQDSTGTDDPAEYSDAVSHGYVATRADGSPYTFISNFQAPAAVIDFTNPAAVRWWQARITRALDLGADGFMQDFGEQVLADMHFHDGSTGAQMHNRLPVLYDRATRVALDAYEHSHPGRHIFFFTRAGYSGTPGNAADEGANFPGDETTDFTRASGLASLTTDMLNRAVGGAYGYSTDIGGYFDLGPYPPTTKELFLRWAEWAALSPLFRLHGSLLAGVHTPWSYDAQTVATYEALVDLHMRARPLILALWQQADRTGVPVTRPLWLAAPGDPRAAGQDQEWLLGPDVLVAPVVTEGARARSVYFPAGCWERPDDGSRVSGPSARTEPAALEVLPYFFRCGTRPFAAPRAVARPTCPPPTGALTGGRLGPVSLGETRARLRARLVRFQARRASVDAYCLRGAGIRVGFPSAALLRTVPARRQSSWRSRAVLALTANHHYALRGIRAGEPVHLVAHRLRSAQAFRIGVNLWYVIRGRLSDGVVKVRRGRVQEVGIAAPGLAGSTRQATARFLRSFG